jgi:superfamily II DNA/RNA helicase
VATALGTRGFAAAAVHGDLGQGQRERALRAFRSGKVDVLVATDVAARGLDVDDVTHVVNYECPEDEKAYLHRIGRTGRAGRDGVAVTFVDWADLHRWKTINETLRLDIADPVETYSTSEHLFAALGIPHTATGVLPKDQRGRAGLEAEHLEDIGETGKSRSRAGRDASQGRDGGRAVARQRRQQEQPRRRTRNGQSVDGGSGGLSPQARRSEAAQQSATSPQDRQADGGSSQAAGTSRPRRRRPRTRGAPGGRPSGPASGGNQGGTAAAS